MLHDVHMAKSRIFATDSAEYSQMRAVKVKRPSGSMDQSITSASSYCLLFSLSETVGIHIGLSVSAQNSAEVAVTWTGRLTAVSFRHTSAESGMETCFGTVGLTSNEIVPGTKADGFSHPETFASPSD